MSDTYKPHTHEETIALVPQAVAAFLEHGREHGIRWWNRSSQKSRLVSEVGRDGQRRYRRKVSYALRAQEEWIAAAVPAFLPRPLVERARATMKAPRPQERRNLARGWELRGLIRCPSCGGAMTTHTAKRAEKNYHYYRCHRSVDYGRGSCRQRMARAERAEAAVWEFVSEVLKDPGRIYAGMDALIEQKRAETRGDPEQEARAWLERLAEVDQERRGYLRLAAKGRMSEEELDAALAELEETRRNAERELEAIGGRREEIEQLERDRDALLASWSEAVPENLDRLTSEERNELYRTLRLEISPAGDGYEVTGPFCSLEPLSS